MEFRFLTKEEYIDYIDEIKGLFEVCFNREISSEFLKWRYVDNPLEDILVCVAIENNKIIANYSVSPIKALIDGNYEKLALSMTTMTHPDFAGKGLFTKLANSVYEKMEELNYKAVMGFPNKNSHVAFVKKLGWRDIYEIPTLRLELSDAVIKGEYNLNVARDDEFKLDYSELLVNEKINLYSSKESLIWRFKMNPINKYKNYVIEKGGKVIASVITKEFNNDEVDIVLMNYSNVELIKDLLNYVVHTSKKNSFNYINVWSSINSSEHETLERIGFINSSPVTYFGAKVFSESSLDAYNYCNWKIDMGVSDVY